MSSTLFRYIFKDLIRIFMLAVGVLSMIMSFGGLLKPLYENGLDFNQVGQILMWSTPTMWAYSLPIAALFATTIVYGRFGADNEITACRAAGISYLWLTIPACVLGLITAFLSVGLLSFVVPASMFQVEKIVYSNLAKLAANQIERSHQVKLNDDLTVFAQSAEVLPADPDRPNDQAVRFDAPVIVQYEEREKNRPLVPKDFSMATSATAYIHQEHEDDNPTLTVDLIGGMRFPRTVGATARQSMQISLRSQRVGPVELESPVRENTKFMDIGRLRKLWEQPDKSRRISTLLQEFVRRDQEQMYLQQLAEALNGPDKSVQLNGDRERYTLYQGDGPAEVRKDRLVLTGIGQSPARLVQNAGPQGLIEVSAGEISIKAFANSARRQIALGIDMLDCQVRVAGVASPPRGPFSRPVTVSMPGEVFELTNRPVGEYFKGSLSESDQQQLLRNWYRLINSVISELNARMSFAVSCLILVIVGCALGMMFRSGNFLSAFAVSVIPALLCIALIVTGQHTCENVPSPLPADWHDPIVLGVSLIWSGNAIVFAIAVVLLGRLQRQ